MNRKLSAVLVILWILTYLVQLHTVNPKKLQAKMADNIIRFHVIANSDSKEDQLLKYRVRDALIDTLYPYFKDVNNINDARTVLADKLSLIEDVAGQVIRENGYTYPVAASFTTCYFPMKVYGDYTFPPGVYEALQVRIGKAQGKNWWCVMFPPLCFVDETYSIITEDSEKKLEYLLTDDELDLIKSQKMPVKIKFKLVEFIKGLFKK